MRDGWDPFLVSFYRGAIGLLVVLFWLGLRPHQSGMTSRKLWLWSILAGLGVAGNFAFYFLSIEQGGVAVAATLMYCAPVFVYLISFALRLERPTALKWIAIVMVMIGIGLLTGIFDVGPDKLSWIGVSAGLLAGLSYAIFIFGFKYAALYGSPQAILVIAFSILIMILIGPSDAAQISAVPHSPSLPLFLALGVFGAGLSFVFYIIGLKQTAPAVASIVAMVEPVTASLFGFVILDEALNGTQILGMALILLTITAMSIQSNSRQPSSELGTG